MAFNWLYALGVTPWVSTMNQNTQLKTGTARTRNSAHGDTRIKVNMINGIEAWFDVDDITLHVWCSNWTGREVVTVCQGDDKRVVSDKRSWRFKTPHAFEHNGQHYLVAFSVGFGGAGVELYRNGVLIDSDQINTTGMACAQEPSPAFDSRPRRWYRLRLPRWTYIQMTVHVESPAGRA